MLEPAMMARKHTLLNDPLMGIDSQNCPMSTRLKVWNKIASNWKLDRLELLTTEIPLEELNERIDLILQRKHKGRTIVRLPD